MTTPIAPRTPGFPERTPASQGNPHLNEWMLKVELWMRQMSALAQALIAGIGDGSITKTALSTFNFLTPASVVPLPLVQDPINPKKFTINSADAWVASSIRMFWNGARQDPLQYVISGPGNRTIELPALTGDPAPGEMLGEGVKADV